MSSVIAAVKCSCCNGGSSRLALAHGDSDAETLGGLYGFVVACISVANYAHAGVGGEHAFQAGGRFRRAVGHDHLSRVLAVADTHAAAVVHGHPGSAAHGVDEGVQDGPVGDGIAAVLHALGLAVGRGHAARIQVVAANHDGCAHFARAHHLVDHLAEVGTLAVPQ